MKLLITAMALLIFSNVTYAWEKMTVEDMKKEIIKKVQTCHTRSYCAEHLPDLNNNSTCDELRYFLEQSGIVVNDPATHFDTETDVAKVVICREK